MPPGAVAPCHPVAVGIAGVAARRGGPRKFRTAEGDPQAVAGTDGYGVVQKYLVPPIAHDVGGLRVHQSSGVVAAATVDAQLVHPQEISIELDALQVVASSQVGGGQHDAPLLSPPARIVPLVAAIGDRVAVGMDAAIDKAPANHERIKIPLRIRREGRPVEEAVGVAAAMGACGGEKDVAVVKYYPDILAILHSVRCRKVEREPIVAVVIINPYGGTVHGICRSRGAAVDHQVEHTTIVLTHI